MWSKCLVFSRLDVDSTAVLSYFTYKLDFEFYCILCLEVWYHIFLKQASSIFFMFKTWTTCWCLKGDSSSDKPTSLLLCRALSHVSAHLSVCTPCTSMVNTKRWDIYFPQELVKTRSRANQKGLVYSGGWSSDSKVTQILHFICLMHIQLFSMTACESMLPKIINNLLELVFSD